MILIVVVIIISVLAYIFVPVSSPNVEVTEFVIASPDNVCGLDGATASGFNATPGGSLGLSFNVTGAPTSDGGTAACTIETISTSTSGFSVSQANVPLVIPANATEILAFTLGIPSSSYTGNVTLVMT